MSACSPPPLAPKETSDTNFDHIFLKYIRNDCPRFFYSNFYVGSSENEPIYEPSNVDGWMDGLQDTF